MHTIEEFRSYHEEAQAWKRQAGGKVIGVFCCDVPEEIIHAAGMLPVRILGGHEDTAEADLHFPTNVCPYPKSCFDQALRGRYRYLDGLVVPNVCDMVRAMYGFWKLSSNLPYIHFLEVPQRISAEGVDFFTAELVRFKESLEKFSGKSISEEAVWRSIEVYNQNRRLLARVYELRKGAPPRISGTEAQETVIASMLMPKEHHNLLLGRLLEEAATRPDPPPPGVRLFLSASMLDEPDFLELVEGCGGSVVADDMPMGSRYFWAQVTPGPDPYRALAERYLRGIACPRKMLPEARLDFVMRMLDGTGVRGAIIHNLKACDCHLYEYPYLKKEFEGRGLPVLFFRGEETATERERQRADIEAFIEMLEG